MKRVFFVAVSAALSLAAGAGSARATEVGTSRSFGLGFQIGEPTAVTAKAFIGNGNALDFGLGFAGGYYWHTCYDDRGNGYDCHGGGGYLSLHMDYLYEEMLINSTNRLDWYVGGGGRVIFAGYRYNHDDVTLLGRVPLGLAASFRRPSFLEAYLEIAPGLVIIPGVEFAIDLGLGVRGYF